MARYDITYSCGHTEDRQLYGKSDDRTRYLNWAARCGTCSACRAKDEGAAIEAIEQECGLVQLTGSAKQIAWARKIRSKTIEAVKARIAELTPQVRGGKEDAWAEHCSSLMVTLAGQAEARWWIDHRDDSVQQTMRVSA